MHHGHNVFAQLMQHLPLYNFRCLVTKIGGNRYVKRFSCLDQYLCMPWLNSSAGRVCVTSRFACARIRPSFIAWEFVPGWREVRTGVVASSYTLCLTSAAPYHRLSMHLHRVASMCTCSIRSFQKTGVIYATDRRHFDFSRLYRIHCEGAFS